MEMREQKRSWRQKTIDNMEWGGDKLTAGKQERWRG